MNLHPDILDHIGNTPVVSINKLNPNPAVALYAKLEGFNPGGSVKDRIAKYMIEKAEESGELTKDRIILEPTSGNTGIGLAMVARVKGYRLIVIMPESMSVERRSVLTALGAEIILTPAQEGMNGAIALAHRMTGDCDRYFMPNQFANKNNVLAHYETTGQEILDQVGKVDIFVAGLGTSGTLMGAGRKLREACPAVKVVCVEPYQNSKIQGLRNLKDFVPPIFDHGLLDSIVNVDDEDAFFMARSLAKEEGLFVGISSGAAMFEAANRAKNLESGTIVTILPDSGDKYLSTELFE
jgi:cysteine synthase